MLMHENVARDMREGLGVRVWCKKQIGASRVLGQAFRLNSHKRFPFASIPLAISPNCHEAIIRDPLDAPCPVSRRGPLGAPPGLCPQAMSSPLPSTSRVLLSRTVGATGF